MDEVLRYKKILEESESDEEILEVFRFLELLEVDRTLLSKTKIGIAVTRHKQHENSNVAKKSRRLLDKWRTAVATQTPSKSTTSQNGPKTSTPIAEEASSPINDSLATQSIFSDDKQAPSDPGGADYIGPKCGDMKRDKGREILYRAFMEGLPIEQLAEIDRDSASSLVGSIEQALWDHYIVQKNNSREYQGQLRSIKANFADKKNPDFNIRIYLGAITADIVATMASTDMASDAKKAERLKAKKESLEACQSDWDLRNLKRAEGQFPCGKCKTLNTTYFQMQTRSSDEPMTTYVNCLNCGNRWKF